MFVSLLFVLFLGILWLIYAAVPRSERKLVLLVASWLFCGYVSVRALVMLVLSTAVVYAGAICIESCRNPKDHKKRGVRKQEQMSGWVAAGTILLFAFILIIVKNIPYAIKMFRIDLIGESHWLRKIVLPVGFSFYAFQAIGYIYDVYCEKEKAERNFASFALYMGFFAKFVSGPIERKGRFMEQLERLPEVDVLNRGRLSLAVTNLLWGYFLKLVVADRLALIVNEIYALPEAYDTVWLVGCAVFYSFQVYTDFAGYTYIAIGCAELFGLELTQNFKSPYWSKNITEFWRRWHISLSSWLRDYVYIPLGGNRKGTMRKYINTVIVFILCGIWHGNGLSFLAWGLLHGMYSVGERLWSGRRNGGSRHVAADDSQKDSDGADKVRLFLSRLVTFLAVTFAWIFFRAESFMLALQYMKLMFTNGIHPLVHVPFFERSGIAMLQVYLSVLLIALVQIVDGICYRRSETLPEFIQHRKAIVRYAFFYVCIITIFVIGIYGGDFPTEKFIYMQF